MSKVIQDVVETKHSARNQLGVSTCRTILFRHQNTQAVVWNGVAAADVRSEAKCQLMAAVS